MKSFWKNYYIHRLYKNIFKLKLFITNKNKVLKTKARSVVVLPALSEFQINVFNGKIYKLLKLNKLMFGHKLGEFTRTKILVNHVAFLKKKKQKAEQQFLAAQAKSQAKRLRKKTKKR